jgi:hypothetical protein
VVSLLAVLIGTLSTTRGFAQTPSPETRAVAYLTAEVPRWRREHPCYSCHNNGDAARALITAAQRGHRVGDALDETLVWLRDPKRWNEKMPSGGVDDKPLARIQFASALRLAVAAGRAPQATLIEAATFVAADQKADGSWQLDSSQSLGSPTTYGTVLATASAVRVLRAAGSNTLAPAIDKGDAWLRAREVATVLDAAAVLLGLPPSDRAARAARDRALAIVRKGQAPGGGWGPYITSPPAVFDTALVMLALNEAGVDHDAIARGRAYLLGEQLEDGSWPETTRPANQESYAQRISTTGWALLALLDGAR